MVEQHPIHSAAALQLRRYRRIKVGLRRVTDRPYYRLMWHDPETNQRKSCSTGTSDWYEAEQARVIVEERLTQNRPVLATPPTKINSSVGYVYLIEGQGLHKIGKSVKPQGRLMNLQVGFPFAINLIHRIQTNDMHWLERFWHKKFAPLEVRGEWFSLDTAGVARFTAVVSWYRGMLPVQGIVLNDQWYKE